MNKRHYSIVARMSGVLFIFFVLVLIFDLNLANASRNWFIVKGQVLDAVTCDSLPSAIVQIRGTSCGAQTGPGGKYFLPRVPMGKYRICATFPSYDSCCQDIEVLKDSTLTIDFYMEKDSLYVPPPLIGVER